MSSTIDKPLLHECLRAAHPNCQISIDTYECHPLGLPLANAFTSEMFRVSVVYECDGCSRVQHLVFKVPYSHKCYSFLKNTGIYGKETYMYTVVLPKLMEITSLSVVPRQFTTTKSHLLVLEDLSHQGYYLQSETSWTFEQCLLVVEGLAKFHAASVKLNQTQLPMLEAVSAETFFSKRLLHTSMKVSYPYLLAALSAEGFNSQVLQHFASYEQQINQGDICKVTNRLRDFNVLHHGDLKANNLLLKNDDLQQPISVKMIDYQMCRWNSPILDLMYFYTMNVDCDLFEEYHSTLTDRYLQTLNASLLEFGCDCAYSREEYETDLRGYTLFRVFMLIWVGFFDMDLKDDVFAFGADPPQPTENHVTDLCRNTKFQRRFLKWFSHLEEQGYFESVAE